MLGIIDESDIIKIGRKITTARYGYVNHTNTICHICNVNNTRILPNGRPHWLEYKADKDDKFDPECHWDGKSYLCRTCYDRERRKLPNSHENWIKSQRKFRNKQLSIYCESGKTYIGEQMWCKVRGVKNCNIEKDNFAYKFDHSTDPEYGITNTKIATLTYQQGSIGAWGFDNKGKYDNAVLFCMDKNKPWKNVERGYIIPWKEMTIRTSITITKNPSRGIPWYEKYRIKDIEPYNNAYHSMSIEDCNVLTDDDIQHWKV